MAHIRELLWHEQRDIYGPNTYGLAQIRHVRSHGAWQDGWPSDETLCWLIYLIGWGRSVHIPDWRAVLRYKNEHRSIACIQRVFLALSDHVSSQLINFLEFPRRFLGFGAWGLEKVMIVLGVFTAHSKPTWPTSYPINVRSKAEFFKEGLTLLVLALIGYAARKP